MLSRVIPGATGFDPDKIPGLGVGRWESFEIDDRHPGDVTIAFLEYCLPRVAGPLVIVNDESYAAGTGPFFVAGEDLAEFAATYTETIGSSLVNGDTIVVSPVPGRVIVVHHNGLIDMLQGIEQPGL
ncbi:hypothetical protein ACH34Q_05810 [Actinomadura sp. 9N407]